MGAILVLALLWSGNPQQPEPVEIPGLRDECRAEVRWLGLIPRHPELLWLVCRGTEFPVFSPNNFLGAVRLDSLRSAEAYLAQLTSERTMRMLTDEDRVLSVALARDFLAQEIESAGIPIDWEGKHESEDFVFTGTVVRPDRSVWLAEQRVSRSGFWRVRFLEQIHKDIASLGILLNE